MASITYCRFLAINTLFCQAAYLETTWLASFSVSYSNFTFIFKLALKCSIVLVLPIYSSPVIENRNDQLCITKIFLVKKGLFCSGLAWRKLYRRSNNDHRNERVGQRCLRRFDTGSFLPSVVPDLNQKSFSVLFPEIVTNVSVCGKVSTNYCITFEFVPSLESFLDFCLCSVFLLSGGLKFLRCLLELER